MPLSTEHVTLIRESWAVLSRNPGALTGSFYERLFHIAPQHRALFAGSSLPEQRRKLAAALGLVVKHAADLRPVLPALEDLGRRHAHWGVRNADYDTVGAALLHAIAQQLGPLCTPLTLEAWAAAYGAVAGVMTAAADDLCRLSA